MSTISGRTGAAAPGGGPGASHTGRANDVSRELTSPETRHMTSGYDPIRTLMDEHEGFLARVEAMRHTWRSALKGRNRVSTLPGQVAAFARFLARDLDELHAAKEERALFPVIARHLPSEGGPVGVMLGEHELLRGFQATLAKSGDTLTSDPSDERAVATTTRVLSEIESLLSQHFVKEDFVLFPTAQEILSKNELAEVSRVCLEIEAAYEERYGQSPLLLSAGVGLPSEGSRGLARS
ncbi:MAG: hemerythrin domain-containing protein [Euryarchaeota archaeon]|nr:hemerythrin domain-containing protein [Euryarchaeota archaeon]MDE1835385.1 hemerythrin domain-containing protein [Euryarchaeota archaeon]MDE1880488.1 hemerythrin domain-containing protein [Euryarchaeota archaeon]MDE2043681.1 hemerythrin domain-containing protein [Thermoplasmata archaeon]